MQVGGNVVLMDAAVSFHQCNSHCSECRVWGARHPGWRHAAWGHPMRCSLGLNSWCHLFWLNGWVPTMKKVQVKSENEFAVNPRFLCSFTLASVNCGVLVFFLHLRPRARRWRWHSSVWKCGCHQHNSSVFTYDSLMNFNWGHFDVFLVSRTAVICGGWFNIMAVESLAHTPRQTQTQTHKFPAENPCGVDAYACFRFSTEVGISSTEWGISNWWFTTAELWVAIAVSSCAQH